MRRIWLAVAAGPALGPAGARTAGATHRPAARRAPPRGSGVAAPYEGPPAAAVSGGGQPAARALAGIADGGGIDYPVVWMDIGLPGIGPATGTGWNTVYTSPCSGRVRPQHIPAVVDRAVFN